MTWKEFHTKRELWAPFWFCAFLSAMKLLMSLYGARNGMPIGPGDIPFYCFLPMCFFGAVTNHLKLQKRIEMLEGAISGQSGRNAVPGGTGEVGD